MSFDYDKIMKREGDHGSWWTSYADLFMMLSIVFLLMYVASSLRNGSASMQQVTEYKKLAQRAEDLEQQIKAYNTLKDEALKKETSLEEQEVYGKLLDKLSLLKDEARGEKVALEKRAKENADKEFALNQYQQMIRNMINANILAKSQINRRDQLIVKKDATINEKQGQIAEMEKTVALNEQQINQINSQLDGKIQALRREQLRSKSSKKALEARISRLRKESQEQVSTLAQQNDSIVQELGSVKGTLSQTRVQLGQTQNELGQTRVSLEHQKREATDLMAKLQSDKERYGLELASLKKGHEGKLAAERRAFEASLRKQQLSEGARRKKLAAFAADAAKKSAQLEGTLSGLKGKIRDAESRLAGAEAEKDRALANVDGLKDDLARVKTLAFAKKRLAEQIAANFTKSGIRGAVDAKTGEVTLDFGDEYFDTGSSQLKPGMRTTLDKFIPVYAKSLFDDPKIADKIANIEVVGFASSTYKGLYVNPKSSRPSDKEAIEYNLKLSFGRANSIFSHLLRSDQLTRADRERLMPLMKIVGRGYLPEGTNSRDIPEGMPEKQFCATFNCMKAQKVIVKFNMKD